MQMSITWFCEKKKNGYNEGTDVEFNYAMSMIFPSAVVVIVFGLFNIIITSLFNIESVYRLFVDEANVVFIPLGRSFISGLLMVFVSSVLCDKVEIIAEARSRNYDKLVAQGEHMKKCFEDACAKFGATCDVNIDTSYISFSVDENDELIKFIGEKMNDMGITPSLAASGGGSDANMYNRNGIKSVVLGTGMDKVHTTNEQITVDNIEKIGELVYRIIKA